jgi:hypothetical protein
MDLDISVFIEAALKCIFKYIKNYKTNKFKPKAVLQKVPDLNLQTLNKN